jgi:DNA-binding XRE family transcriptional regulator
LDGASHTARLLKWIIHKKGQYDLFSDSREYPVMPESIHHSRNVAVREQMRELRKAAGFTQGELADLLKADQSYISKVERGERYADLIFYLDWVRACGAKPSETVLAL